MPCLTPIKLLVCLLSVATALSLLRLSELLAEPSPWIAPVDASAQTVLVHRFYAAFNATVGIDRPPDLDGVLGEDIVAHLEPPGSAPTRDGVIERLAALRATYPSAQLQPQDVRAQGDTVVAQVRIGDSTAGAFLGLPLDGNLVPWGAVDVFRIAGGVIAEIWSGRGEAPYLTPVAEATLDLPESALNTVALERVTLEPGASIPAGSVLGPEMIYLEVGRLTVADAGSVGGAVVPSQVAADPLGGRGGAVVAIVGEILAPGDVLLVPLGARAVLRNAGELASEVLMVSARRLGGVAYATSETEPVAPFEAPSGVVGVDLAPSPLIRVPGGPALLGLGHAVLAPGATWPVATAGVVVLVIGSGSFSVERTSESAWSRRGADGPLSASTDGLFGQGDAIAFEAGAATVHSAGDSPLVCW